MNQHCFGFVGITCDRHVNTSTLTEKNSKMTMCYDCIGLTNAVGTELEQNGSNSAFSLLYDFKLDVSGALTFSISGTNRVSVYTAAI